MERKKNKKTPSELQKGMHVFWSDCEFPEYTASSQRSTATGL